MLTDRSKIKDSRDAELYQAVFARNSLITLLLDPATQEILDANESAARFYGYSVEELRGLYFYDISNPEPDEFLDSRNQDADDPSAPLIYKHVLASGESRYVAIYFNYIHHHERTVLYTIVYDKTDQILTEIQLHEMKARMDSISQSSVNWDFWIDNEGKYLYMSPVCEKITGYQAETFMTDPDFLLSIVHPEDRARVEAHIREERCDNDDKSIEFRIIHRDGGIRWIAHNCSVIWNQNGEAMGRRTVNRDITALRQYEEQMRLTSIIMQNTSEGIILMDAAQKIIFINDSFASLTGYSKEEIIGQNPSVFYAENADSLLYTSLWKQVNEKGEWHGELRSRRRTGEVFPEWVSVRSVRSNEGKIQNYVAVFSDITARKQMEIRMNYLAQYDPVTLLPNRDFFIHKLTNRMHLYRESEKENAKCAVISVQLDRFRIIADTHGSETADFILQTTASRLLDLSPDGSFLGRTGPETFCFLFPLPAEIREKNEASPDETGRYPELSEFIHNVLQTFTRGFTIDENDIYVQARAGISIYPSDGSEPTLLIRHSESASHRVKPSSGTRYSFFRSELNDRLLERVRLESRLHQAMKDREFVLYFQPQECPRTGELTGMEALVRWQHPELGIILPGQFIPIAEENGLIVPLGEWVLEEACRTVQAWKKLGLAPPPVAVNFSAVQFHSARLPELLSALINSYSLTPSEIELELTESAAMDDLDFSSRTMNRLNELGFGIALDDFGTGYSSLLYIKRFPVKKLKIDRTFIMDIGLNPESESIIKAVIRLAAGFRLHVTAEGIETKKQFSFLKKAGVHSIQGNLISEPLPFREITKFIHKKNAEKIKKHCKL